METMARAAAEEAVVALDRIEVTIVMNALIGLWSAPTVDVEAEGYHNLVRCAALKVVVAMERIFPVGAFWTAGRADIATKEGGAQTQAGGSRFPVLAVPEVEASYHRLTAWPVRLVAMRQLQQLDDDDMGIEITLNIKLTRGSQGLKNFIWTRKSRVTYLYEI
jgi:hypothetical protein